MDKTDKILSRCKDKGHNNGMKLVEVSDACRLKLQGKYVEVYFANTITHSSLSTRLPDL